MNDYEDFFEEIKALKEKCKREETFNAFQLLGVNEKETMHSRFIGMLLDPKGKHNQGDKFLQLFLQQIVDEKTNQLIISDFKTEGASVLLERSANSRRIDISIENTKTNHFIIIENKIWAGDQDRQLVDYYNWAKVGRTVYMIYLTPYGKKPSDISLGNGELLEKEVICISYEKHILNWLEGCVKDLQTNRLRTSLEMYEELIRTVINRDKYMETIIEELKNKPKQMELAIDIVKAFQGRDFLEIPEFKERFIEQIEGILKNYFDDVELSDSKENWSQLTFEDAGDEKGSICFDGAHIYGKGPGENGKMIDENQIVCNDLNNQYLVDLLTNNQDGIKKWIEITLDKLIGVAENHIE